MSDHVTSATAVPASRGVMLLMAIFGWRDDKLVDSFRHTARIWARRGDFDVWFLDPWYPQHPLDWSLAEGGQLGAHHVVPTADGQDVVERPASVAEFYAAIRHAPLTLYGQSYSATLMRVLDQVLSPDVILYQVLEDACDPAMPNRADHDAVRARASLLLSISPATDRHLGSDPRVVHLGQYVDPDHWRVPAPASPRWAFGFFGNFTDWIDCRLMADIARACPTERIGLVGPFRPEGLEGLGELLRLPNVEYVGPVAHAELPPVVANMEVCLLPRTQSPRSLACNPLKLYECMAAGKPLVATPLEAMQEYGDILYLAPPERFVAEALRALADVRAGQFALTRQEAGLVVARERSWAARADRLTALWDEVAGAATAPAAG